MARVFVSSTFSDMEAFRDAAESVIKLAGNEAVRLEYQAGSSLPVEQFCAGAVQACDAFVLILGGRYGTRANNPDGSPTDKSLTEWEHLAAIAHHIPRIVLVAEDPVTKAFRSAALQRYIGRPGPSDETSLDWEILKQDEFRKSVKGTTPTPFADETELKLKLQQRLFQELNPQPAARAPGRLTVASVGTTDPGLERLARLCDRDDHLTDFGSAFDKLNGAEAPRPQVYVLYGGTRQSHDRCIERLICYHIRRLKGDGVIAPQADRRVVSWPSPPDPVVMDRRLRRNLFLAVDDRSPVPEDLSGQIFAVRAAGVGRKFIVLIHTTDAATFRQSRTFVRDYYLKFWDEVAASRLAPSGRGSAGNPRPAFLSFFDIVAEPGEQHAQPPPATGLRSLWQKLRGQPAVQEQELRPLLMESFESAARSVTGTSDACFTAVLPELGDVSFDAVNEWWNRYGSRVLPEFQNRTIPDLFPKLPLPMLDVEQRLRTLLGLSEQHD